MQRHEISQDVALGFPDKIHISSLKGLVMTGLILLPTLGPYGAHRVGNSHIIIICSNSSFFYAFNFSLKNRSFASTQALPQLCHIVVLCHYESRDLYFHTCMQFLHNQKSSLYMRSSGFGVYPTIKNVKYGSEYCNPRITVLSCRDMMLVENHSFFSRKSRQGRDITSIKKISSLTGLRIKS